MSSSRRNSPPIVFVPGFALAVALLAPPSPAHGASLKGSRESVERQTEVARSHGFSFLVTPHEVQRFVKHGALVSIPGDRHYELAGVSYPYGRPELKLFIERLAEQYHAATGEKLVVTSLTRPKSRQPRNASQESVHPAGMAVDIRRSRSRAAQKWLEKTLLSLEDAGVLEATRERRPPHYHVAIFPRQYVSYLERKDVDVQLASAAATTVRVGSGDSLWGIATRHGVSVEAIVRMNGLSSNTIFPGQMLRIPAR